jgi:hypothetical protein
VVIQVTRLPIVLCCAEESEVALVAVVDALHREGYAPEVVPGVETDTTLVTTAVDRLQGPALFVLCQSIDLDRFQVRRIEGLFSARRGPDHRLITIEVAGRGAAAIVADLQAEAREVAKRVGAGGGDDDDGRYMRDVVAPTSVAAVPGTSLPARGAAERSRSAPRSSSMPAPLAKAPEGISDEALGLRGGEAPTDTEVVDPFELERRARASAPAVQLATGPATRAAVVAAGYADEPESDGVPLAVPEDFPVVGESGDDVTIRGASGRIAWDRSGPIEVERVARPSKADPRAETDDRPLPSASSPIDIGRPVPPPAEPAPREQRGARVLLLLVAIAGLGAVVTMAVLHATAPSGPGDAPARGVPVPAAPPTPSALPSPATRAEPAPAGVERTDETSPGAVASGVAGGRDEAEPDDGAAVAEPDDGAGPSPMRVPPPPPPDGGGGAAAGEDSLEAAIADGRVREANALLVIGTGPSTVTWNEADARCSRRKVGGLRNWRLPTRGQLAELRRAKLLAPGTYWSRSTVGDDEAFAVEAGSGQAQPWLKAEPNGLVVCVRPRP